MDSFVVRDILLPVAIILALLALLSYGVGKLSEQTEAERLTSARNSVVRAAVQCYALEGRYPLDIRYLEEHYGLQVNPTDGSPAKYIVHYQAFAANIMPDIDVMPLDFSSDYAAMGAEEAAGDWTDDLP